MAQQTEVRSEVEAVLEQFDGEHLVDRLQGRGGGLRVSKPDTESDDGLIQYIWRQARFHSGQDTSLPVTAAWWLQEWLDEQGIDASVSGITDDAGKAISEVLQRIACTVLEAFGLSTDGAIERWEGLAFGEVA